MRYYRSNANTHQNTRSSNLYEPFKTEGTNYDRAMDSRHWIHPSKHITTVEGQERPTPSLQVHTDGSRIETVVAGGIAVFEYTNLIATQMGWACGAYG